MLLYASLLAYRQNVGNAIEKNQDYLQDGESSWQHITNNKLMGSLSSA